MLSLQRSARVLALLSLASALAGCNGNNNITQFSSGTFSGNVFSGSHAIRGAQVHVYVTGSALKTAANHGNGAASRELLSAAGQTYVTTDSSGAFNLKGDYTCTSATDQVYVAVLGGDPGTGAPNPALAMVAVLGNCGNLATTNFIAVNAVTTAAAAWALAPFVTAVDHIGASTTNQTGIANAMLNAQLLASSITGQPAPLAANQKVETPKLYALANLLAACNSLASSTACTSLFSAATPTGGTAPANTFMAAVDIVRNPGHNVGALFSLIPAGSPYPQTLTAAPHDWSMSLTVNGGGVNYTYNVNVSDFPTQIGIDTAGDVWAGDYYGAVSAFSPQGIPLSPSTGFGRGILADVYGLAVDTNNNVWVTNEIKPSHFPGRGSLSSLYGITSGQTLGSLILNPNPANCPPPNSTPPTPAVFFCDAGSNAGTIAYPEALASDSNGNILIASNNDFPAGAGTIYSSTGTLIGGPFGFGYGANPVAISGDGVGGLWLANDGSFTVTHLSATGALISNPTCCNAANGIAVDAAGNAWVSNYYSSSVSAISPLCDSNGSGNNPNCGSTGAGGIATSGNVILVNQAQVGGLQYPEGLAIDAAQNIWVANYRGNTISQVSGYTSAVPGTGISPTTGYGLDAGLTLPDSIVPDASGNIWVSNANAGNGHLTMFFGLAAPTATPAVPGAPAP